MIFLKNQKILTIIIITHLDDEKARVKNFILKYMCKI